MLKPSFDDLIRSSVRSILKNKSRTLLTSLGIIIGVTSVILLTSIGNGLKVYINNMFDSLGSNSIFIAPGKVFDDNGNFSNNESSRYVTTSFTFRDLNELKRNIKNSRVFPNTMTTATVKAGKVTKKNVSILGVTADYAEVFDSLPGPNGGKWFTQDDDDKKTSVVVLGDKIASDLFPSGSPLNRKIIINGRNFKVIGLVPKKGGSFGGPSFDDYIYAPLNTVFSVKGDQKIIELIVKINDKSQIASTKDQIKKIMLKRYEDDAFSVFDSSQLLNSINSIIGTLTIALTGIAAISLVVGGIGIMNIMLVTVSERTREIGLRKAIGAYPSAILLQFLIEAIILSALGGAVGILLGWLGTLAINNFFPAKVTLSSVLIAFGVSSMVGVIFGVAPARKASKLSPIEALRYE